MCRIDILPAATRALLAAGITLVAGCSDQSEPSSPDIPESDVQRTRDVSPTDASSSTDLGQEPDTVLEEDAVTDALDGSVSAPEPPVAVAGEDLTTEAGTPVTLDGSQSFDPDGTIVDRSWFFGDGNSQQGEIVFYTYINPGEYVVQLRVTDDDGLSATDTLEAHIRPSNDGPSAVVRGPSQVLVGEEATFDGRDSTDDRGIASWEWDPGVEGVEPIDGPVLDTTWSDWGEIDLRLTVRDDDGESDTAVHAVAVLSPPTAIIEAPTTAIAGEEVTFDGLASFDEDGTIVTYHWQFPDPPLESSGTLPTHTFSLTGELEVFLTVTDDDDLDHTASHKIVVSGPPNTCPTAALSTPGGGIDTGETVSVSAEGSTDADGSVVAWTWDWGDGSGGPGDESETYAWDDDGVYTVTLTVTDDDGCTYDPDDSTTFAARASNDIDVRNRPPVAVLEASDSLVILGDSVHLDGRESSDPDGSVESWEIDLDDGRTWSLDEVEHTYDEPGDYRVTLTVTDDDGAEDTDSVDVAVREAFDNDYNGTWIVDESVAQDCYLGLGAFSFSTVTISHTVPIVPGSTLVQVSTNSTNGSRPGTMTGRFDSPTHFDADFRLTGACTETYVVDVTFTDATHADLDFEAGYAGGGACLDCTNTTWERSIELP